MAWDPVPVSTPAGIAGAGRDAGSGRRSGAAAAGARIRSFPFAVAAAALVLSLLRAWLAFRYRVNSDEPQHLHVVWGWAHGLLQYRDVTDNHTPLFHLLMAPFFLALGPHAGLLAQMRVLMIPLYLLALWCTWRLGETLFSPRVGVWACVLSALMPPFFLGSLEFRADDLWMALWMVVLVGALGAAPTPRRAFGSGLVLGAAVATSMKTLLLAGSLGVGAGLVLLPGMRGGSPGGRSLLRFTGAALAGTLAIPAAVTLFYATRAGGLAALYQGVIGHNLLPGLGRGLWPWRQMLFPVLLAAILWGGRRLARRWGTAPFARRRLALYFTATLAPAVLLSLWPLVTRQDFLPLFPPLLVLVVAAVDGRFGRAESVGSGADGARGAALSAGAPGGAPRRVGTGVLLALALLEAGVLVAKAQPWHDGMHNQRELAAEVLALTGPADTVMDRKGETVFRRRAPRYVLETITRARLRRGVMPDDIPEHMIAADTRVAIGSLRHLPPRTRRFLQRNYLRVGALRVAGMMLIPRSGEHGGAVRFELRIPARYALVSALGPARGRLDGRSYDGPRWLAPGRHEFRARDRRGPVALIWARALERGFSPFRRARMAR